MDKIALLLTCLVVVIASIIIMPNEVLMVAEAIYSIPPTPAWSTIHVIDDPIIVNTTYMNFSANSSSDDYYYGSDGSINITITDFTP